MAFEAPLGLTAPTAVDDPTMYSGISQETLAYIQQLREMQAQQQAAQAGPAAQGPGSPDQLVFNRAPMGGGLNPFVPQGPATTGSTDPSVPVAMTEADTRQMERSMMPAPTGGIPAQNRSADTPKSAQALYGTNPDRAPVPGMPGIPAQPSVTAASTGNPDASNVAPVRTFDPNTNLPVSSSPRPMTAPGEGGPTEGAGRVAAAAGVPQAAGESPNLLERFAKGLNNPEVGNLLLNVGIGLMSNRGFGPGIAAGLQGYQSAQAGNVKQALEQFKLQQQIQGQQAQRGYLIKKGYSPEAADAMIANGTLLTNELSKEKPNLQTIGGNVYDLNKNGGVPGQSNLVGPADGPPSGFQPGQGGILAPIPGGPQSVEYKKAVAEATRADKAQIVKVKDEQGVEHAYVVNQDENGATTFTSPKGVSETTSAKNPFAGTGKQNNDQAKASGYADRMFGAEPILRKFEDLNSSGIQATIAEHLPNGVKSTERQQMEQAQRNFINAQLRRESGAAISESEFANARQQYFPQPGDKPEVIAQKRINRQEVISGMARDGGQSYQPPAIFGPNGEIVPFGQKPQSASEAAPQTPAQPSRAQLEAEARRRGLIK